MFQQKELLNYLAQTSDFPLAIEVERTEGIYIYDKSGRKLIDMISGICVNNLGHGHPVVVKAIKEQLEKYLHVMVYGEYVLEPQMYLAKMLAEVLPSTLDTTYLVNSGSEAVEGALKLAKRYTARTEIIAFNNAYHGSTHGALSIMGNESFKTAFRPLLPDINFLNLNATDELDAITRKTACVIIEPIQGEAGVRITDKVFMKKLHQWCKEMEALLIFDEVQSGFGRTGTLFAFEQYEIIPDILLLAKGFGGGMPLGAFIASKEMMDSLKTNPILGHITTFGGHPLSCAASIATLNVLKQGNILPAVKEKGQLMLQLLQHEKIKEVRGLGLMIAIEFENEKINKLIIGECLKQGILTDWFLFDDCSMRIAPPLIITESEIRTACEKILLSINKVYT